MTDQTTHAPESIGITKEELTKRMPRGTNHKITEHILGLINNIENDTALDQGMMEEKVLSSLHLLSTGQYTLEAYINAVKFVNLKQFMSNKEAWSIVFRKKFNDLEVKGKQVDNFVAMYNGTQLVVELGKKLIIAPSLQYNHIFHEMVEINANLARGVSVTGAAVSPMVQHLSATKLMEKLGLPEDNTIELKVGMNDESKSIQLGLTEQLAKMADVQMARLANGESINDVQKLGIIDVSLDNNGES